MEHLCNLLQKHELPLASLGEKWGRTTALSRCIALWLRVGLWLDMGIACPSSSPRLLEEPPDPQAPTRWAMLGAAGPEQPESPPISSSQPQNKPQQENLAAAGLSFPPGYLAVFRGTWFNSSNHLSYS